ncbi:MAG: ABC transporter ATP-binding protein/permease, partial [Lachnospiraceae bacterium]|nr:ABC transporter ATP-binding protein/permease [Lachnospiraceae bacterium]
YKTGGLIQKALDGVSLSFRDNEFVAILGPSGSGKTTLLNIIGGLDRYDTGDLLINGVSTKKYKDGDWDTYRNHSIGFVFQSYNLISHQSVLQNVELALTISGISKAERRRRAKEALEKVGLGDQLHKKPNQMSGGQMQRVAIARALVNNPEILLADEPTGALDSQTGIQVMELLKEVAHDRLVIMVTHNPELANAYATRIVNLRDGKIVDDSNPPDSQEAAAGKAEAPPRCASAAGCAAHLKNASHLAGAAEKPKKASMTRRTSLGLSLNNLLTKKRRTITTAVAGSIGIIGIALILSLSSGVNQYIENLQKSTMSSYPITISASTVDISSLGSIADSLGGISGGSDSENEPESGVHSDSSSLLLSSAVTSSFVENDLTAFKQYLDDPDSEIAEYIGENGIVYSYDTSFDVYAKDEDGNYLNTSRELGENEGTSVSMSSSSSMFSMMTGSSSSGAENFEEMLAGTGDDLVSAVVTDSYDMLYGNWPENYDEVVLVLDENNSIDIAVLCQLGLISDEQYEEIAEAVEDGADEVEEITLDYSDVIGTTFQMVTFSDYYTENEDGTFTDVSDSYDLLRETVDGGLTLTVTGIVRANEDASTTISATIGYTSALTEYIIDHTNSSAVILAQEADPETNVLTGLTFAEPDDETKAEEAAEYLSGLGVSDKATMYTMLMYMGVSATDSSMEEAAAADGSDMVDVLSDENSDDVSGMEIADMAEVQSEEDPTDEDLSEEDTGTMQGESQISEEMPAMEGEVDISSETSMDETTMAAMLDAWLADDPDTEILTLVYDNYLAGGSYDENMEAFGKVSFDAPSSISIYSDTFDDKDMVAECITDYNKTVDEDEQITYTDYVALMTSAITTMVNLISYVLIAFVAISLVVSCIMISIITQISVIERTKEIGILRAIGASKRNISQVFNAETFIIGIASGTIGIVITELLILPINELIHMVAGSDDVNAILPWNYALILIIISIVITVLSGLAPAHSAAKKDPVVALRTE